MITRNDDGRYNSTSDSYRDPKISLKVKYPKENQLLLKSVEFK